ncbi:hypothetical protein LUX34_01220 [Streptomyces werraensis]|nr:hypothetical protein [Streptomyces werraensis]
MIVPSGVGSTVVVPRSRSARSRRLRPARSCWTSAVRPGPYQQAVISVSKSRAEPGPCAWIPSPCRQKARV